VDFAILSEDLLAHLRTVAASQHQLTAQLQNFGRSGLLFPAGEPGPAQGCRQFTLATFGQDLESLQELAAAITDVVEGHQPAVFEVFVLPAFGEVYERCCLRIGHCHMRYWAPGTRTTRSPPAREWKRRRKHLRAR